MIDSFLLKHYDSKRPLLLALSGGPDSLALFYMLLELGYPFAVAHVDHGWRPESGAEAAYLAKLAKDFKIPFHLKTLNPQLMRGNLEAACREERLQFFKSLCSEFNYQAVLTGHHADDRAETVLKRLFEGSRLTHLSGLQEVGTYEGMTLWRPLLHMRKNEILEWLKEPAFHDSTNTDNRFLRARMRQSIIPWLDKEFGKQITPSLLHLGQESAALNDYLLSRLSKHLEAIVNGKWGLMIDFTALPPLHPFELRSFIPLFAEKGGLPLSREAIETIASLLENHAANKRVMSLEIDRGRLFLPQKKPVGLPSLLLTEGTQSYGPWSVTVSLESSPEVQGWQAAWQGHCTVNLPEGSYSLAPIPLKRNDAKIPAFLRSQVPGIWEGKDLIHDFLINKKPSSKVNKLKVSLTLI